MAFFVLLLFFLNIRLRTVSLGKFIGTDIQIVMTLAKLGKFYLSDYFLNPQEDVFKDIKKAIIIGLH